MLLLCFLPFVVEVCVEAKRPKRPRVVEERADKVVTVGYTLFIENDVENLKFDDFNHKADSLEPHLHLLAMVRSQCEGKGREVRSQQGQQSL